MDHLIPVVLRIHGNFIIYSMTSKLSRFGNNRCHLRCKETISIIGKRAITSLQVYITDAGY